MRLWRRRRQAPPPVVLPSLDRLAGLIERVVELVDEVAGAPPPVPERAPERAPVLEAAVSEPVAALGWLAFVPSPQGYALVPQPGSLPAQGDSVELEDVGYRVLRHAPSPLPGDRRRCAFLEREEPPATDRSSDA